ncbi:MAG TPA: methylated-DNA--[protein]-cysteine S-methyltransferase [Bacillales bacterium]|nr:methylated-DNA--[protein]-cysteine S-methyltransferase [Bacillales bacterium]
MSNKPSIFYGETDSPIGPLTIVSTPKGVCKLEFGNVEESMPNIQAWTRKHFLKSRIVRDEEQVAPVINELDEYFQGERFSFDLPLILRGTPFQRQVWETLKEIPHGETRSYKQVAQQMKAGKAVRAVGNANNKNPLPILIPCHRVIGSNGSLVGYGGGVDKKQYLLEIERTHTKIS